MQFYKYQQTFISDNHVRICFLTSKKNVLYLQLYVVYYQLDMNLNNYCIVIIVVSKLRPIVH